MCLRKLDFALERKKVDGIMSFVGTGYKVMWPTEVKNSRMIGNWRKALPWNGMKDIAGALEGGEYFPGYHIWIDIKDAMKYYKTRSSEKLYKVSFMEVIAFGTNRCGSQTKPCVIANWIKYECELDTKTGEVIK